MRHRRRREQLHREIRERRDVIGLELRAAREPREPIVHIRAEPRLAHLAIADHIETRPRAAWRPPHRPPRRSSPQARPRPHPRHRSAPKSCPPDHPDAASSPHASSKSDQPSLHLSRLGLAPCATSTAPDPGDVSPRAPNGRSVRASTNPAPAHRHRHRHRSAILCPCPTIPTTSSKPPPGSATSGRPGARASAPPPAPASSAARCTRSTPAARPRRTTCTTPTRSCCSCSTACSSCARPMGPGRWARARSSRSRPAPTARTGCAT